MAFSAICDLAAVSRCKIIPFERGMLVIISNNKMETEQRQKCVVRYQIATYSGEEVVYCAANDDNDVITAKAKRQIKQKSGGSLPFGYESYNIIEREDYYGE